MGATTYKENGYTHVVVVVDKINDNSTIEKGFKSKEKMDNYLKDSFEAPGYTERLPLTVNQAIKLGY